MRLAASSGGTCWSALEITSTERGPELPLKPLGNHAFTVVLADADPPPERGPATLTFVNPMQDGRMEHVAMGGRLYRRAE